MANSVGNAEFDRFGRPFFVGRLRMHVLGKILTWVLFVSAGGSVVLMSRKLQVKNSYTEQLAKLKAENAADAATIKTQEKELARLDGEYDRLMYGWHAYWDSYRDRQRRIRPATGRWSATGPTFSVNGVGLLNGVGKKISVQDQAGQQDVTRREIVHLFEPARGNAPGIYIGPFEVLTGPGTVLPQQVTTRPMWTLQPRERAAWLSPNAPSRPVRVRPTVPAHYPALFSRFYAQLESVDRNLVEVAKSETAANNQLKSAKAEVTRYRDILFGRNGGLVKDLETAEEARNSVLAVVDELRRALKRLVDFRDALAKAIREK
ncbi:MAG: hypothetical protein ACE5KM_11630 [Planctomycetaceae bacterium]